MASAPTYPMHASRSAANVDIHSRDALQVPNINFTNPDEHNRPVLVFRCLKAVGTCVVAKQWHFETFGFHNTPDLLRIDTQALHELDQNKEGTLIVLENIGTISSKGENATPIHIMALLMPKDGRIRFFYSAAPYVPLVRALLSSNLISPKKKISPSHHNDKGVRAGTKDFHCRIFTFLTESFRNALQIPHAQDYLSAMSLTDFSPEILSPSTALQRIEHLAGEQAFPVGGASVKDLSNDRYLLLLHPAERELASVTDLQCAEYLLIKRVFFKEFYEEVVRTEKKVGVVTGRGRSAKPVRLRSETKHIEWFERVYGWTARRAKRLISGWEVLGLLDERRLLPWIKAGGMLAESELVDDVEYEDEDGGDTATETTQSGRGTPDS